MNYNKITISSSQVYCNKVTNLKIYIDSSTGTLIDGTVLDSNGNPVPNAGIEIIQVSKISHTEKTLGCVFTDAFGKYAFTLNMSPQCYYRFKLYSSI